MSTGGAAKRPPASGSGNGSAATGTLASARALVALAFNVLDVEVVAIAHDPENENSKRAIRKYVDALGGREDGRLRNDYVVDGDPRNTVNYSITAEEGRAAAGSAYEATFEW